MPTCPSLMDGPSELDFGDWQHPAPTESFQAPALPTVSHAGCPGQLTSSASHLHKGPSEPQPRRIPGPAGRAPGSGRGPSSRQPAGLAGAATADVDFLAQPWQAALGCLDINEFDERHPFLQNTVRTATTLAKSAKLSRFVAIVMTLQRTYSGQAFIRLKDPTGAIGGTISKQALDAEPGIQPGSVLILEKVTILRLPSLRPLHHICITLENIAQVVPAAPVASQQQISSQPLRPLAMGLPMLPAPLSAKPPTQPMLPATHYQHRPTWGSEQPAGSGSMGGIPAPSALATSQTCSGMASQHGAVGASSDTHSQNHRAHPCPAVAHQPSAVSAPYNGNLYVQPGRSALQQCNSQLTGGQQQQEQHKPAARPLQTVQGNSQPPRQGNSEPQRSDKRERSSLQQHEPQETRLSNGGQPATSHTSQLARPMQPSQGQQNNHHMGPPPPRLGPGMGAHDQLLLSASQQGLHVQQLLNQPPHRDSCQDGSTKPLGQIATRGTAWLQGLLQELPPTDDFGCSQATQAAGQPASFTLAAEAAAPERDAKRSGVEECLLGAEAGFGDGIDELMAGLEDELGL